MNQMAMNGNMPNGVPGGMAGMNNGIHAQTPNSQADDNDYKTKLNTYIYDYLLRNEQWDCARAIASSGLKLHTKKKDNNSMDTDTKDEFGGKKPVDLELPANILEGTTENSFLLDWFTLFWEIFLAPRNKRPPTLNPHAVSYAGHIRDQSKIRQEAQSQFLRQPGMPPNMQQYNMMRMPNAAMAGRMPQNMQNPQGLTPQQQMLAQRQRMMQQQGMERAGSDMEMNGQRPRTPSAMMPGMEGHLQDFYANPAMRPGMPQNPGAAGGNHALQDYQMQLMLLEQQNKKRLLMARQEQDSMRPDGANMGGQQAFTAPGMSPQGSRSGPSPNPSDQMKRGTPKLNQAGPTGSPVPDGMQRGSPGAMNFHSGNVPMEMMQPTMNGKMGEMPMGPNGVQMRPPSSHPQNVSQLQIAQIRQAQANGHMLNGANWQQGPQGQGMMNPQTGQMQQQPGQPGQPQQPPQQGQPPGQQPNQQGQLGTPQPRNAMPPPTGVPQGMAANALNVANARPASPAQSAASTTPQQTNKANPKKKDAKEPRKRPNKKNNAAAATPSADGDNPPPTPTGQGQTPITPMNKSFEQQKAGQQPNSTGGAPAPTAAPAQAMAQAQPDAAMMGQFGEMDNAISSDMNMEFNDMDAGDVLNTFDFDAFLQDDNNNPDFDIGTFDYGGLEASGET